MITSVGSPLQCASLYLITDGYSNSRPKPNVRGKSRDAQAIRRVAVVEDELMVAWSIETMLEELGFEVVGLYPSGEQALLALARDAVDLLFMDINLGSGIDGIKTARRIRGAQAVPVIFISAYSDRTTRSRALEEVPDALFLDKPFAAGALKEAIDNLERRLN